MQNNAMRDGREDANRLIKGLGDQLGIPGLRFEEDDACVLSFNEQMITLSYDKAVDNLSLFAMLDRVPGPFGPEGMAGLMELNAELFDREQATVVYNQTTLLVGQLFRTGASSLRTEQLLPWIDRCLVTIEETREKIWELLGADRQTPGGESGEENFLHL